MAVVKMRLMEWLMEGDPAIRYQVKKDILEETKEETDKEKARIHQEGWGKRILEKRDSLTKMWGGGIYSPKFISTHYTLLQLKKMGIFSRIPEYLESAALLIDAMWYPDGKVNNYRHQDMCVVAMILGIVTYGKIESPKIGEMVDYILGHQFPDGGWNCLWERGAVKSSLHTTLSVVESFRDYEENGYTYRLEEMKEASSHACEWMLRKKLFRSEHTNEIIHPQMLVCPYPSGWKYDILRALEFYASIHYPYDERMSEALDILVLRMDEEGKMPVEKAHAGKYHFRMENPRLKSRWNTLRMLRVLKEYRRELYKSLII